ncbi:MAG TPA: hypothetical protein VFA57_08965 [Pseudolabrys sp.]|nr:hypothetical protein [Pseudolabrys sp.]
MRKTLCAISIAALAAVLAAPATAAPRHPDYVAPTVGVVGGTVVGLGLSEGWWGAAPAVAGAALPTTAVGAAAVGGVAGIGGIAFVDAMIEPCQGFQAMFLLNERYCAEQNAQRIAYAEGATRPVYRHGHRVRHYYR